MEDIQIQSEKVIAKQGEKIAQLTNENIMQQVVIDTLQENIKALQADVEGLKAKADLGLPQEG